MGLPTVTLTAQPMVALYAGQAVHLTRLAPPARRARGCHSAKVSTRVPMLAQHRPTHTSLLALSCPCPRPYPMHSYY